MPATLNYISEFPRAQAHGGWDGMGAGVVTELGKHCSLHYVGPVRPPINFIEKAVSKSRRLLGARGSFYYYSHRRLHCYAEQVEAQSLSQAEADFFHGATPWVCCHPPRPYYPYIDACFETYLALYLNPAAFLPSDIARIVALEKSSLAKAARVFVSSQWCRDEIRRAYGVTGENIHVVGLGGALPIPERDEYRGELRFLCVATNFERKGGRLVFEAFKVTKERYPDAVLTYVGEAPPKDMLGYPGVFYAGYLHKQVPEELAKLTELFAQARVLLVPSAVDMTPVVIAEAGYYGCPAISVNCFGIAEMIKHAETGLLLQAPVTAGALSEALLRMCSSSGWYDQMRQNVRRHCIENLTWQSVVRKMLASADLATPHL
jgi:glycosyltransferase involved in cell wall biosynthesis